MNTLKSASFAILASLIALPATAFDGIPEGVGVEAGISSLGAYLAPTYQLNDTVGLRAPVYFGSYEIDDEFEGNDASFDFDAHSVSLLADWHPFRGNFKVSGGLALGGYEAVAGIQDPELDGITFAGNYDFEFEQKSDIAPVLSIGYELPLGEKFALTTELGAKFATYEVSTDTSKIPDETVRADMERELKKINDDLGDFNATPFLSLGLAYQF